jgi:hypothetical protein
MNSLLIIQEIPGIVYKGASTETAESNNPRILRDISANLKRKKISILLSQLYFGRAKHVSPLKRSLPTTITSLLAAIVYHVW